MKYLKFLILICVVLLNSCDPTGGKTEPEYAWKDISIQSVEVDWRSVQMLDENTAFIGGIPLIRSQIVVHLTTITQDTFMYNIEHSYKDDNKQPCLYKTTNGGDTWEAVSTPFRNGVKQILFLDDKNGYVSTFSEGVFRTKDGGLSWESVLGYVYYGNGHFEDAIFYLNFSDTENGYAFYDSWTAFTLNTKNGGDTWGKIEKAPGRYIYKKDNIGYNLRKYQLYKTTNNGNTWSLLDPNGYRIYDIHFYNSEHFLALSGNNVLETTNGGETWTNHSLPINGMENKMIMFDSGTYVQTWENIYHFPNILQADSKEEKYLMLRQKEENRIYDMSFPNPNIGLAVGDKGTILRYRKEFN